MRLGANVIGPVPSVMGALHALSHWHEISGAVLDISLSGETAYPIADALLARRIPFLFVTRNGRVMVPRRYSRISLFEKPLRPHDVIRAWSLLAARPGDSDRPGRLKSHLISRLDAASRAALRAHLQLERLPARARLTYDPDGAPCCYFLSAGLASCVMTDRKREAVEVGLIGSEGATGLSAVWSDQPSPARFTMLVPGYGARISAAMLRKLFDQTPALERVLKEFSETFLSQVSANLLAAARYRVDERVARWLSLVSDRIGNRIPIPHDTIAMLLGVRRAGVTIALNRLREMGCITSGRKEIVITDRGMLTRACRGCYGPSDSAILTP